MDGQSNVTEFPGTEQRGLDVDEKSNEGFDAGDQAETHKQKLVEIGETLESISDEDIRNACERVFTEIYEPRKRLNKLREEIVEPLKEKGLQPAAFNAMFQRYVMDQYKREIFDKHMAKCSNAMDLQPKLL